MTVRSIRRVCVKKLFGTYDYELEPDKEAVSPQRLLILYGDNGSGKTTILRMLFHLLAPDLGAGHKTTLSSIPFSRCEIDFATGERVWVEHPEGKFTGSFEMGVSFGKSDKHKVFFREDEEGAFKKSPETEEFLHKLGGLNIALYFLSDDRTVRLAGIEKRDFADDRSDQMEGEIILDSGSSGRIVRRRVSMSTEQSAQGLLIQSLRRAERWIQSQAVRGSSQGESSVNTLYADILGRITSALSK